MPKVIDPGLASLITKSHTLPIMLAQIDFATPIRVCSISNDITWNALTWTGAGIIVGNVDENANDATTTIEFAYSDALRNTIATEGIGQAVHIYRTWADSPSKTAFGANEMMEIFSGIVSGVPRIGDRIIIEVQDAGSARVIPFMTLGPPMMNANAPIGEPVSWNGKSFQVVEG